MDFNQVTNIEICRKMIEGAALSLVYYSHIPTAAVSLLTGVFVFYKKKDSPIGKILLAITISFSVWAFLDLALWIFGYNSQTVFFFWSLLGFIEVLFFALSLYFVYLFIDKKDISFTKKLLMILLLLPVLFLTPTRFNLSSFDASICEATETTFIITYQSVVEIIFTLWIIVLSILRYRKADRENKKQVLFLVFGMCLFLLSFSWSKIFGSLTLDWDISQYGLFGMPIFLGFLAYLIVRYKAFDIKLIATQALVAGLVILIGSELFFAEKTTNQILILITLAISLGFGYMLIKSVKLEVERKEQLQEMSDKLAQANDQLRKLDNAKTEFISIASHQLRTPLTAVKGFVSMLLEGTYGEVSPKVQEVLDKVYLSNERLINLVEDLLNVSRMESGRMEYKFEECQIEDILKELADTFFVTAKDKKMSLTLNLPPNPLPKIKIDSIKVKEVFSNLIDNAFKYTKRGGVKVSAELIESSKPQVASSKGVIRITVSDTGIGIPPDELPYLFSKFSRGKDTTRLHATGTGLGLYVGKFMIEAHQGKIWAESDGQDKGSRFIVELPV
jgi:signal transduction histidine kinase